MNIREISKPVTSASLNESLARRFGQKIKLEDFTLEQLQDARNKVRTRLSQVETNESFNAVQSETYQKSKLFLDVLNAAISERENIGEGEIPPQFKKNVEKMKAKGKDKKKETKESVIREGAEESAELVMAAKDMVDRVTGWMEDTAEMQTESMLELADSIRDEMGSEQSEAFVNLVKPSLEALFTSLEATREALTSGVGVLTGQETPEPMGGEEEMVEPEMEPTVDADAEVDVGGEDEFAAAEPAVGGEEEAGRAQRESIERSRRLGTILSKKK